LVLRLEKMMIQRRSDLNWRTFLFERAIGPSDEFSGTQFGRGFVTSFIPFISSHHYWN
jgi:hypothetical protein